MESLFRYLIIASISITLLFLVYQLFFKKENNFKFARAFLVSGLIFSLLLPFNSYHIEWPFGASQQENTTEFIEEDPSNNLVVDTQQTHFETDEQGLKPNKQSDQKSISSENLFFAIYLIISLILAFRILFSVFQITWYYLTLKKQKLQGFTVVYLKKRSIPFSFFNLIFIGKQDIKENSQIIEHEKIHAKQIHTIDLLITELLVAAMWFNPFIWMYKRELQQVHEFLADEGVLNSGVDQLEYQTLLVNHAAEGRLVAVSSNFSYSLIKKRIKMMSKKKTHGKAGVKLLLMVPVLILLILGVSCANGQEAGNDLVAAVSPTKMNVLYIGVDNPVAIGVTGADMNDVEATIDKGSINGENGNYIVRVKKPGTAKIIVKAGGKVVAEQMFRVKRVPDPKATINGIFNKYEVTKDELISAKGIRILLVNFDFDLNWEVESFYLFAAYNDKTVGAEKIKGGEFSQEQIKIIKEAPIGTAIVINEIKAKGPDGAIRDLGAIMVKIAK